MSTHKVPGTTVEYHLVRYDEDGAELHDADGTMASEAVLRAAAMGVTDVFLLSHGWKGDVPTAIAQYDRWIGAMARQEADADRIRAVAPDFMALLVGLHWPSLPWGDERAPDMLLGGEDPATSGDSSVVDDFADEAEIEIGQLVDLYTARLTPTGADEERTEAVRTALTTLLVSADDPSVAAQVTRGVLPDHLTAAYETLAVGAHVESGDPVAAPGADHDTFDPRLTIEQWVGEEETAAPDNGLLGPLDDLADLARKAREVLLMPVRQLSFWTMKRRAATVGERGIHDLLKAIQRTSPRPRVHLMGHSFGCIVVSAAIAGPVSEDGTLVDRLADPVDAVFLVQGAMSLWSYADDVPHAPGSRGYFQVLRREPTLVRGPLVTTRSIHDTAVGKLYPLGARVVGDVLLGEELPKFGGIGTWGIQGAEVHEAEILASSEDYGFSTGHVYNVEASRVIRHGGKPSGAHSDISHDEVAHLMWQAATAAVVAAS